MRFKELTQQNFHRETDPAPAEIFVNEETILNYHQDLVQQSIRQEHNSDHLNEVDHHFSQQIIELDLYYLTKKTFVNQQNVPYEN